MAKHPTLMALFSAIADSLRAKLGTSAKIVADDFPSMIDSISTGIVPTGIKSITANGEYDVTDFAKVNVAVPTGPNIKVYKVTLSADHTNMWYTLVSNDPFLASLYNDPNAFILMYGKNTAKASTSMKDVWFYSGTTVTYAGATARNNLLVRQSTSAITVMPATGISADNYNGNFKLDSTGTLKTYGKTDYVMVAGEYCIIAGSV